MIIFNEIIKIFTKKANCNFKWKYVSNKLNLLYLNLLGPGWSKNVNLKENKRKKKKIERQGHKVNNAKCVFIKKKSEIKKKTCFELKLI